MNSEYDPTNMGIPPPLLPAPTSLAEQWRRIRRDIPPGPRCKRCICPLLIVFPKRITLSRAKGWRMPPRTVPRWLGWKD